MSEGKSQFFLQFFALQQLKTEFVCLAGYLFCCIGCHHEQEVEYPTRAPCMALRNLSSRVWILVDRAAFVANNFIICRQSVHHEVFLYHGEEYWDLVD